jgi:hypothetical protein
MQEEPMREATTTALDILGLLLIAAGLAAFLWVWIGAAALAPAGFLILAASHLSDRQAHAPARKRAVSQ